MVKNIKIPLLLFLLICVLFAGIIIGAFIGRSGVSGISTSRQQRSNQQSSDAYGDDTTVLGKININIATEEELSMLPGIGTGIAKRIITYRIEHGAFFTLDELMNIDGIGEDTLAKLRPYATVGG